MIINYKQPYWVKFQWDMSTHHDNQYVTEYNKTNNKILDEFLLNDNYIITCDFKITEEFKTHIDTDNKITINFFIDDRVDLNINLPRTYHESNHLINSENFQ
jgi:hypothetical protein